jgi:hypothetical protein
VASLSPAAPFGKRSRGLDLSMLIGEQPSSPPEKMEGKRRRRPIRSNRDYLNLFEKQVSWQRLDSVKATHGSFRNEPQQIVIDLDFPIWSISGNFRFGPVTSSMMLSCGLDRYLLQLFCSTWSWYFRPRTALWLCLRRKMATKSLQPPS